MKKFEIHIVACSLVNPFSINFFVQQELSALGIDRLGFAVALRSVVTD